MYLCDLTDNIHGNSVCCFLLFEIQYALVTLPCVASPTFQLGVILPAYLFLPL